MAPARPGSGFQAGGKRALCPRSPQRCHRANGRDGYAAHFTQLMFKRLRHVLRVFARSNSWRFAMDVAHARTLARSGVRRLQLAKLRWHGRDAFYRPATSDPLAIYQVLLRRGGKAEYYLPERLD